MSKVAGRRDRSDDSDDYDFDSDPGRGTPVDVKLFKAIGLYQMLRRWPADRGRHLYRGALSVALWLWFCVQIVQTVGMYYMRADVLRFAVTSAVLTNTLLNVAKGYVVIRHADRLRDMLRPVAGHAAGTDDDELNRCRAAVSVVLRVFVALGCGTNVLWLATPWLLLATHHDGRYVPFTHADGTVSEYRVSVYNMWWPVSAAEYNRPAVWSLVYVSEAVGSTLNVYVWQLFDCYVINMCYTLHAQFRSASAGYASLGGGVTGYDANTYHYDELIRHIKDTKKVMKKFDDFFDLIRPVVIAQIALGSYSAITLIFVTSLMYVAGVPVFSVPFFRIFGGLLLLNSQLFMYCYLFNYLEMEKKTVNFGLYSSNWTEMNLKFKKTLLLEMSLNSSHKRVMKLSPLSIVNLELFTRVMNMSFSIVSVLLNIT